MRVINKKALFGAVLGGAMALAGALQAQDFGLALSGGQARQGQALSLNFTMPFGGDRQADAPRLGLRFSQGDLLATPRSVDLADLSFAPAGPKLRTAFNLNAAESASGWIGSHKLLFGAGVVVVGYGIYEATKDDNNKPPSGCGSNSRC